MNRSSTREPNSDIAITGYGCVLPCANNPEEFWSRLLESEALISPLPDQRMSSEIFVDPTGRNPDKPYSNKASFIAESVLNELQNKYGRQLESPVNPMTLIALEAASQALKSYDTNEISHINSHVYLGAMFADEKHSLGDFYHDKPHVLRKLAEINPPHLDEIQSLIEKHFAKKYEPYAFQRHYVFASYTPQKLKQIFALNGPATLVDAACASSLAALDRGLQVLRSGEADMVITGGVERDLSPTAFLSFCAVGALAREETLPFDQRSSGLHIGEGAVIFCLQRLTEALEQNRPVYGVIKGLGGSSDGRSSSLFAPTQNGQIRAFKKAYQNIDPASVDYIEAHGTGTRLGDSTELQSMMSFFKDRKIPFGSSKAIWGHTRGAAGAVGLLKAVKILEHKTVPPSKYFKSLRGPQSCSLFLNTEKWTLDDKPSHCIGISSFGFGGINYHAVLESVDTHAQRQKAVKPPQRTEVKPQKGNLLSQVTVPKEIMDRPINWAKFMIPPKSLKQLDATHLQAVYATSQALKKAHIPLDLIDPERVVVIAASTLSLPAINHFSRRVRYHEVEHLLKNSLSEKQQAQLAELKNLYPEVTEDTGHGVLNNVIAGRVANLFNFTGKTLNIDGEYLSFPLALQFAIAESQGEADLAIVLGLDEELSQDMKTVYFRNLSAFILGSERLIQRLALPVESVFEVSIDEKRRTDGT